MDRGIRYVTERLSEVRIASSGRDDPGDRADRADRESSAAEQVPGSFFPNTTRLLEIKIDRENDYVAVSRKPR